jgi:hypothetical protein
MYDVMFDCHGKGRDPRFDPYDNLGREMREEALDQGGCLDSEFASDYHGGGYTYGALVPHCPNILSWR